MVPPAPTWPACLMPHAWPTPSSRRAPTPGAAPWGQHPRVAHLPPHPSTHFSYPPWALMFRVPCWEWEELLLCVDAGICPRARTLTLTPARAAFLPASVNLVHLLVTLLKMQTTGSRSQRLCMTQSIDTRWWNHSLKSCFWCKWSERQFQKFHFHLEL